MVRVRRGELDPLKRDSAPGREARGVRTVGSGVGGGQRGALRGASVDSGIPSHGTVYTESHDVHG